MIESAFRRKPGRVAMLLAALALAGCVAEGSSGKGAAKAAVDTGEPLPGRTVYACEDQTSIIVDNRASEVTVTDSEGDISTLPAAPADQRSRYGIEGVALVLDGAEALFMKGRHEPVNCRR